MTARSLAASLASDLAEQRSKGDMLRLVRQFVMDADRGDTSTLIGNRPDSTGDRKWDALIAGVVEDLARRNHVKTPAWTREQDRYLDEWWFVTDVPRLHAQVLTDTPAALSNHGVYLSRAALVNV